MKKFLVLFMMLLIKYHSSGQAFNLSKILRSNVSHSYEDINWNYNSLGIKYLIYVESDSLDREYFITDPGDTIIYNFDTLVSFLGNFKLNKQNDDMDITTIAKIITLKIDYDSLKLNFNFKIDFYEFFTEQTCLFNRLIRVLNSNVSSTVTFHLENPPHIIKPQPFYAPPELIEKWKKEGKWPLNKN